MINSRTIKRANDIPLTLNGANIITSIAYSVLLALVVRHFIAGPFAYLGYVPRTWTLGEIVTWIVSAGTLGALNYRRWRYPSHAAFTFLLATIALPVVTIPVFWGPLLPSRVVELQCVTVLTFATMKVCLVGNRRGIRLFKVSNVAFWSTVVVITLLSLAYLLYSTGLSPQLLRLSDVYTQRDEYAENVTSLGSYLVGWVGAGIFPAILAAGLHRRSRSLSLGATLGILVLYSVTGNKSYLVGIALAVTCFVLCSDKRRGGHRWLTTLGLFVLIASVFDYIGGGFAFTTLIVRRALATAGLNTAYYFQFFSQNPHYELRHSVLSFAGAPPYSLTPPQLIGDQFYGSSTVAANANLIADGYANFGILGCLLMATVFGLYLRAVDKASRHLPLQISAPALTLVIVAAANSAALTVLSTHGGLALLLLLLAMPPILAHSPLKKGSLGPPPTGTEPDVHAKAPNATF